MKTLTQNAIVSTRDGNIIDNQITHQPRGFTADIDLRHRTETAHGNPFYHTVRPPHIESNVPQAPALLAHHLASILQNKAPTAIATYSPLQE